MLPQAEKPTCSGCTQREHADNATATADASLEGAVTTEGAALSTSVGVDGAIKIVEPDTERGRSTADSRPTPAVSVVFTRSARRMEPRERTGEATFIPRLLD